MITNCYRIKNHRDKQNTNKLIINFIRHIDKINLLKARNVKRNLSTKHLGLNLNSMIYMCENLIPEKSHLFK